MEFTKKYEKVYSSIEEFQMRYDNFRHNLIHVISADNFEGTHTVGITKFSDMSEKEFKDTYLTLKSTPNGFCAEKLDGMRFLSTAPDSLDWVAQKKVSQIKDQGSCGSCWAFSTVGYLESLFLMRNQTLDFSEQQLVDCDRASVDQGCNGGLMHTALNYVSKSGIERGTDYPYRGVNQQCKYDQTKVSLKTVGNIKCFENLSDDAIIELLQQGPVSIAVDATSFQTYRSGILKCNGYQMNHAVLLVGYGVENGQKFWKIKNSWGTNWGEQGYVRVLNSDGSDKAKSSCLVGGYLVTAELPQ